MVVMLTQFETAKSLTPFSPLPKTLTVTLTMVCQRRAPQRGLCLGRPDLTPVLLSCHPTLQQRRVRPKGLTGRDAGDLARVSRTYRVVKVITADGQPTNTS